jgi:hypothetical protein
MGCNKVQKLYYSTVQYTTGIGDSHTSSHFVVKWLYSCSPHVQGTATNVVSFLLNTDTGSLTGRTHTVTQENYFERTVPNASMGKSLSSLTAVRLGGFSDSFFLQTLLSSQPPDTGAPGDFGVSQGQYTRMYKTVHRSESRGCGDLFVWLGRHLW